MSAAQDDRWPALTPVTWEDTQATLHLWTQILGKTRLALAPMENHWWQVVQYVTARGLGTSPMPWDGGTFDLELDLIEHRLAMRSSHGATRSMPLESQALADFYRKYRDLLASAGIEVRIRTIPSEIANPIPFDRDRTHGAYDPDAANRLWRALVQADRVFKRFRGSFLGKCSPVHFWWGGFDLACTRFSGRPAPTHPGGIPNLPDWITREAYSHECISAGFWPGSPDSPVHEPIFYAYAYPEPPGCPEAMIGPDGAGYHAGLREWTVPYETIRASAHPDATLLEFLTTTYTAAANLGGWNRHALERTPDQAEAALSARPRLEA
jgi:hypothetical protein